MSDRSLFDRLAELRLETKHLKLARPADVIERIGDDDTGHRYGLREGAETFDIPIRPLSSEEVEKANEIADACGPPPRLYQENADGSKSPLGFDEEDPEWIAKREKAYARRSAFVCLTGCPELGASTPGGNDDERIQALRAKLPDKVLHFIASNIVGLGFEGGALADFFTSKTSGETPSSDAGKSDAASTPTGEPS